MIVCAYHGNHDGKSRRGVDECKGQYLKPHILLMGVFLGKDDTSRSFQNG